MKEPKTPHEEVMFVVESTNDIVSEVLDILNKILDEMKLQKEPLIKLARKHGLAV